MDSVIDIRCAVFKDNGFSLLGYFSLSARSLDVVSRGNMPKFIAGKEKLIEKNKFFIPLGRESEGVLSGQGQRHPHLMRVNLIAVWQTVKQERGRYGKVIDE